MSGADSAASAKATGTDDHGRSHSRSRSPSGKRRRLRSKSGSRSAGRGGQSASCQTPQAADQSAASGGQAEASAGAPSCDDDGKADAFLANMAKASLQAAKAPDPGEVTERQEKAEAVEPKGESKPHEPTAVAAEAPATEQRAQLTVQTPGGPEAPRICKEIDSESIRTWLSPIALGDDERLAKLTELICAALADEHGFNRCGLLARLLPHTGGIGLEAMASLEDLLDWLEQERGQAGPPPADPRIGRRSEEPGGLRKWAVGDAVVLRQLKSHPELNGRQATIVQAPGPHEQVSSRCTVVLEEPLKDGRVQLSVKPENMRPAGRAAEAGGEPPQAGGGGASPGPPDGGAAPAAPRPRGAAGVFGSNLERLRARADAERREGPPSRGRGQGPGAGKGGYRGGGRGYRRGRRGHDGWDEQSLREPVAFVPAEQQPVCSRAVVVVDPRGQGVGDGASDDERGEGTPGHILPPAQPPAQASPQQPRAAPAAAAEARRAAPPEGNLTLAVSAGAREEDRAQRLAQEKRSRLDQSRREMIAKLTKQLQVCLARVQKGDLDDRAKEKFQDMIATLRAQMDKVSGVS